MNIRILRNSMLVIGVESNFGLRLGEGLLGLVVANAFMSSLHSSYVLLLLQMTKIWHGVLGAIHVVFSAFTEVVAIVHAFAHAVAPRRFLKNFLLFTKGYSIFLFRVKMQTNVLTVHNIHLYFNIYILFKN